MKVVVLPHLTNHSLKLKFTYHKQSTKRARTKDDNEDEEEVIVPSYHINGDKIMTTADSGKLKFKFRSMKKKVKTEQEEEKKVILPYLSADIMYNIFTRIPADSLQHKFKYQCKEWFRMISDTAFVNAQLLQSAKAGIIFIEETQKGSRTFIMKFVEFIRGVEVIKVRKLFEFKMSLHILSSCNGMLLVQESVNPFNARIINPITQQGAKLPSYKCNGEGFWFELVFLPCTNEYKVVELLWVRGDHCYQLNIMSLDDCCWTSSSMVTKACINPVRKQSKMEHNKRVVINGVVYVLNPSCNALMYFDLNQGKSGSLSFPFSIRDKYYRWRSRQPMEVAGSVSVLVSTWRHHAYTGTKMAVWVLKDIKKGAWVKQIRINTSFMPENMRPRGCGLKGSIKIGDIIIFKDDCGSIVAYDVKTKMWRLVVDVKDARISNVHMHVNSLISLENDPQAFKQDGIIRRPTLISNTQLIFFEITSLFED